MAESASLMASTRASLVRAAAFFNSVFTLKKAPPVEAVEIPYEETTLPSATLRFWSGAEPSFSTSKSRNFSVELPQLMARIFIESILQ